MGGCEREGERERNSALQGMRAAFHSTEGRRRVSPANGKADNWELYICQYYKASHSDSLIVRKASPTPSLAPDKDPSAGITDCILGLLCKNKK